jgi:hypothetical protein
LGSAVGKRLGKGNATQQTQKVVVGLLKDIGIPGKEIEARLVARRGNDPIPLHLGNLKRFTWRRTIV